LIETTSSFLTENIGWWLGERELKTEKTKGNCGEAANIRKGGKISLNKKDMSYS